MEIVSELPVHYLLAAGAAMLFGGLVHGSLGLGFPMVVTPLLAIFLDVRTAILLTLLPTAVVNLASLFNGGRWLDSLRTYWRIALCCVIGGLAGAAMVASTDPTAYQLLLAMLVFLFLGSESIKPSTFGFLVSYPTASMVATGLTAGFAAGTTNVMVPILIIYSLSLSLPKNTMVQMFNLCFLCGKLSQMVVFGATGTMTTTLLIATIPFAVLGFTTLLVGQRIRDKIPTKAFRRIVRGVLLILAIVLLVQGFHKFSVHE